MSIFSRTLEQQYEELVKDLPEENKRQDNPFGFPKGFFKVRTAGGEEAIGFYCPKCKTNSLDVHKQISHCGRVEVMPNLYWFSLLCMKTYKLRSRLLWI